LGIVGFNNFTHFYLPASDNGILFVYLLRL
jgi:hypothetical protein